MNANRIRWPCDELPYKRTCRAKLYGDTPFTRGVGRAALLSCIVLFLSFKTDIIIPLFYLFGLCSFILVPWYFILKITQDPSSARKKDGKLARKAFEPWRQQWVNVERAAQTFAGAKAGQLFEAFNALPLAPPLLYQQQPVNPRPDSSHSWRRLYSLAPPSPGALRSAGANFLDPAFLQEYATLATACVGWSLARLGATVVRTSPTSIACFWQPCPAVHYFVLVRQILVPGNAALEIEDGYQFWIPDGARARGERGPFVGEVAAFSPKAAFWKGFWTGYFAVHGAPPSDANVLTTEGHRERMLLPEYGDSLDLAIIYAARKYPVELDHVIKADGTPLFPTVEAHLQAMRESVERMMQSAMDAAARELEEQLHGARTA